VSNDLYSPLIDSALVFAAQAHRGQARKGTDIPYIVHPVGVMLLLRASGETDPEVLAAALLHDTLEDCGVPVETRWETRKQHTVEHLRTAPRDVQLISAADKLHNLTSLVSDHAALGDRVWSRFNRGPQEIAWYYRAITASLQAGGLAGHPLVQRLAATVEGFFGPAAPGRSA
jgi:(p)ppGpp synthase/HD superfamily hydrolase